MFLAEPEPSTTVAAVYEAERDSDGYVGNNTRLWCHRPDVMTSFIELRNSLTGPSTLTDREVAVLVTATAAARSDSYCALAWGTRLAGLAGEEVAAAVLTGASAQALDEREAALADWARAVVADPNTTTAAQVAALRASGLTDREIFEATAFIAFRQAFSTVDNALGAQPDLQLAASAPEAVRAAASFGRPPATAASV